LGEETAKGRSGRGGGVEDKNFNGRLKSYIVDMPLVSGSIERLTDVKGFGDIVCAVYAISNRFLSCGKPQKSLLKSMNTADRQV